MSNLQKVMIAWGLLLIASYIFLSGNNLLPRFPPTETKDIAYYGLLVAGTLGLLSVGGGLTVAVFGRPENSRKSVYILGIMALSSIVAIAVTMVFMMVSGAILRL